MQWFGLHCTNYTENAMGRFVRSLSNMLAAKGCAMPACATMRNKKPANMYTNMHTYTLPSCDCYNGIFI